MDPGRIIFDVVRGAGFPVPFSNLVVSQARHETADFTSNVFRTCKNAFGYKYAGQVLSDGSCLSAPEGGQYARYGSIQDSAAEIVGWIRRRQKDGSFPADLSGITTPLQYAQALKNAGYYGDPVSVYAAGLSRFAVNYGAANGAGGGLLIAAAVFLYLQHKKKSRIF